MHNSLLHDDKRYNKPVTQVFLDDGSSETLMERSLLRELDLNQVRQTVAGIKASISAQGASEW